MIAIREDWEIERIKAAGKVIADLWKALAPMVKPGTATSELDRLAYDFINDHQALPAFKGYRGYPATLCISINHEVVHGIPRSERILREGDLVSIDVGTSKQGYIADAARSYYLGSAPSPEILKLLAATKQALELGIQSARAGSKVSDISRAIQQAAESTGFSTVRDLCGHGVGQKLHEEPEIPNYVKSGSSPVLAPGMVLAIEPMINAGGHQVKFLSDGWTVVTADASLSAHFEDTVVVTAGEPLIVTR
ncbi:type I methionyl aminopeptidase [candidate division TA06 bacterium]|uniref:Methionine aminopeptidase n=1 Tax=candidate division TA06 bacterium TaxID=2250710 RepID=A0A933I862_UNCT6|nr:type I methionyl aminopeptidase [candidate division TA06 bacterium]